MNCYYCNGDLCRDENGWDACNLCNVMFYASKYDYVPDLHIKWIMDIGNNKWALNIFPDRNITYLTGYFPDKENDWYDEMIFHYIIKVNKDTVLQKVKTILTFQ